METKHYIDPNCPFEAIKIVQEVLKVGSLKHPPCSWRKETWEHHLSKAHGHIHNILYDGQVIGENHLAHALCRLAMAVAVKEQEVEERLHI